MSAPDDVPEVPSHALHDLLADLNTPSSTSRTALVSAQSSSWSFPSPSARSSPSQSGHAVASLLPRRTPSREHSGSALELDSAGSQPPGQPQTLFNTPSRSILSSGPPTSSISINTAQASMSAPSPGSPIHPLSSLSIPSTGSARRTAIQQSDASAPASRRVRISRAEKDVDDPTTAMDDPRTVERGHGTPTALSKLFTAPEAFTPSVSRHSSYVRSVSGNQYTRGSEILESWFGFILTFICSFFRY